MIPLLIPTRHPSWRELARRTGGEFRKAPFWRSDQVVSRLGPWTIHLHTVMLDSWSGTSKEGIVYAPVRGTRLRAPFHSLDGFRFDIRARGRKWLHRRGLLGWEVDPRRLRDAIGWRARRRRRPIGHPEFDERYGVETNDPVELASLLEASIIARILSRPELSEVRIELPAPDGEPVARPASLILCEWQMVKDADQLLDLHEVAVALLDGLARLRSGMPPGT